MSQTPSLLIRPACPADCDGLALLVGKYWSHEAIPAFDRGLVTRLLQQFLARPELGTCWVAEEAGRLCGYLVACYVFSLEHGGVMAELDELFVLEELRSAGLGARLVRAAEADMARAGIVRVQLQVAVGNRRAHAFYGRLGFAARSGYALWDRALPAR